MATRKHIPPFRRRSSQLCIETALAVLAITAPMGSVVAATTYSNVFFNGEPTSAATDDNVYSGVSDSYISGAIVDSAGGWVSSNGYITVSGGTVNDQHNIVGGFSVSSSVVVSGNSAYLISGANVHGEYVVGGAAVGGGTANTNLVTVSGAGTFAETVIGGVVVGNGSAYKNVVTINGGTVKKSVVGGKVEDGEGNAYTNSAIISGGAHITSDVVGGQTASGIASANVVKVDGANTIVGGRVIGGYVANSGTAEKNSVTIGNSATVNGPVYGGYVARDGDATKNVVEVTGKNTLANGGVYGAYVDNGSAGENSAIISGGATVGEFVVGGAIVSGGIASGNVAIVDGANTVVNGYVAGGYAVVSGSTVDNSATISGGAKVNGFVVGGSAATGDATGNLATVTDANTLVSGGVYGAYVGNGSAGENSAVISGSARISGFVIGGGADTGNASGNVAIVDGANTVVNGDVGGGYTKLDGDVESNEVTIGNSAVVSGTVFGGYAAASGDAVKNSATISGGAKVYGFVVGGGAATGEATENLATVSGASTLVSGGVYGAYVDAGSTTENSAVINGSATISGFVRGGGTNTGSATENVVEVTGAGTKVIGDVAGGYASGDGVVESNSATISNSATVSGTVYGGFIEGNGEATSNVVTVTGTSAVVRNGGVYGAYVDAGSATENSAVITGSAVISGFVRGGGTDTGTVTSNVVEVTGDDTKVIDTVAGGYLGAGGLADSNQVTISGGGNVTGIVYGGYAAQGGELTGNLATVTGTGTTVTGSGGGVYGAYVVDDGATATGNSAVIANGATVSGFVRGGGTTNGTVTSNVATVTGTTVTGTVAGGYVGADGLADSNQAIIDNGATVSGSVYGAYVLAGGEATGNSAIIGTSGTNVTVTGDAIGGYVASGGTATDNQVVVVGNGTKVNRAIGGFVDKTGTATGNTVTVESGANAGNVYGVFIVDGSEGTVEKNSAVIKAGANITSSVYGGYASAGNVTGNTAEIASGAIVTGIIYGGYAAKGDVTGNEVVINGGTRTSDIIGGAVAGSGYNATGNIVRFTDGTTVTNVYGGQGATNAGDVFTGNQLVLEDGVFVSADKVASFGVIELGDGASLANNTSGNVTLGVSGTNRQLTEIIVNSAGSASLTGATLAGEGFTKTGEGTLYLLSGTTTGNTYRTTRIEEGKLVIDSDAVLGYAGSAVSDGNVLAGGTLELTTDGGEYTRSWYVTGTKESTILASAGDVTLGLANSAGGGIAIKFDEDGGKVVFSGGKKITVLGGIKNYDGGEVEVGEDTEVSLADGEKTDLYNFTTMTIVQEGAKLTLENSGVTLTTNKLVLEGDPQQGASIRGANGAKYVVKDAVTVTDYALIEGLASSEEGTFEFDASGAKLIFKGEAQPNEYVLNFGSTVKVNLTDVSLDLSGLKTEDWDKAFDFTADITGLGTVEGRTGYLTRHRWTKDGRIVDAAPETKSISEGFLGGIGLLSLGGDLVTGQGLASAAQGVAQSGGVGQSFAALGGGKVKHKTGSHVDVSGTTLVAGLAAGVGPATVGAFIEYGDGDYDSYNSFSSGKVHGSGDSDYFGAGFLGRYDLPKTDRGRAYLEATARFGQLKSDFRTDDFGARTKYDVKSNYYGLSLGGGHVWNLSTSSTVDLYGRYVWTRQAGDSTDVETPSFRDLPNYDRDFKQQVKFSAVDSHRVRAGVRYSTAWSGSNRFYVGGAGEHEFDGDANAKIVGTGKIDAPSMKGSTGIAEFGLVFNPADSKNLSIDVGIQVYGGKRQGTTGGAQLKYDF